MRTVATEVYTFDELSSEAQKKVVNDFRDILVDDDYWSEPIKEDFGRICSIIGIELFEDLQFTGFYSQGDGASFTGEYKFNSNAVEKIKEYAPKDKKLHKIVEALSTFSEYSAFIRRDIFCRYLHENSVTIHVFNNLNEWLNSNNSNDSKEEVIINTISVALRDLMRWAYDALQRDYEHCTSDETVINEIKERDWEFLYNGIKY